MKKICLIVILPMTILLSSCGTIRSIIYSPNPEPDLSSDRLHEESLKENEKIFKIKDKKIKVEEQGFLDPTINFKGEWYIVPPDYVKTYNENQDSLISEYEIALKEKTKYISTLTALGLYSAFMTIIFFIRKKVVKDGQDESKND